MADNKSFVGIGLKIDYQKTLQEMTNAFKSELTEISNEAKKIKISKDVGKQFEIIGNRIDGLEKSTKDMFETLNNTTISASNFDKYQSDVSETFEKINSDISEVFSSIRSLKTELKMSTGVDFVERQKKKFDELYDSVSKSFTAISEVIKLQETSSSTPLISKDIVSQYKSTLNEVQKIKAEINRIQENDYDGDTSSIVSEGKKQKDILDNLIKTYNEVLVKKKEMSSTDSGYSTLENDLIRIKSNIVKTIETMGMLDSAYQEVYNKPLFDNMHSMFKKSSSFEDDIEVYISKAQKIIETNKEIQSSFNTFQIKNGVIHVPVDIAANDSNLKEKLQETIKKLQNYAENNAIIAKVKLTLGGNSEKGYKNNATLDKQIKEGQNDSELNVSKVMDKAYRDAVRNAEKSARAGIKQIQEKLGEVKIKITPDFENFEKDLTDKINSTFKKISKEGFKLNINSELNKLIESLKEVSTSLSGNEGFKLGLDESSIMSITDAIENMANMIKRAFNVASDSDIANQWSIIENKFKSAAGEQNKLLVGNKEHKIAIQEIATEYKKYLDMGGTNELSGLTKHAQTIKNIINAYEKLNAEAKESQDILDGSGAVKGADVKLNPTADGFKADADKLLGEISLEKEVKLTIGSTKDDIKNTTKANKNLETQAEKTETSVKNEATVAETASAKFRKLAKEKGTAVVANRELAKAAKETADALEKEARIRKETGTKTGKGAVDELTYADNFSKWQREIKQSLIDSGNYAEVYDAKVSQASNGTVKFTAVIRDLDGVLKKFSAKVNDVGDISSPSISDMSDKQAALFEKRQRDAQRVLDAMAAMEGGAEKQFLDRAELERSISALIEAEEELDRFKIKKVSLEEDGKLAITTEIKEANGQVKTFIATFDSISDIIDEETGSIKNFAKAMESAYDSGKFVVSKSGSQSSVLSRYEEIYEIAKKLGSLDIKIAGLDSNKNANQIQELTAQYRELDEVYTKLVSEFFKDADVGKLPMGSIQELNDVFENVKKRIDEIKAKLRDAQKTLEEGFSSKAQDAFNKFNLKHKGDSNWGQVSDEFERLRQSIAGIDSQDKLNEFKQKLSDIAARLNNIGKDNKLGNILGGERTFKDINEVRANIDSLFASMGKVNEKSIRVKGTDKLTTEVKKANGEIRKMTVSLDSNGFARFVDNGIVQFNRLRSAAEGVFKGIQQMVRIYLSPQDFIRYFRQGFDRVREIDTSITELKKVSDASNGELASYFGDAVMSAKELGSSVNDMISATADWSRMGYNLPDAKKLGEVAVLYKNVGDGIDIEEANSSLVSTLQGFQMEANEAESIIDSFNEVSNNFAISSGGIGEALKRSAAAFNAANTDLNQAIALITAGNEVVQNPEKVGKHYANLYSNVLIIKVAISVKSQRWSRPR